MVGRAVATPAVLRDVLLEYLAHHLDASDTLDGVRGWWLPDMHPPPSAEALHATLDALEAEGKLIHTAMVHGSVLYARSR